MDLDRVSYKWAHRWSVRYQQTVFFQTLVPKEPNPDNFTFYKGILTLHMTLLLLLIERAKLVYSIHIHKLVLILKHILQI